MELAFLALGSNIGDRFNHLCQAVQSIKQWDKNLIASPIYETKPVGYDNQGSFLNMVVQIETDCDPMMLLRQCQSLEKKAARIRTIANGPRTLDVDILIYGQRIITEDDLSIPHPRLSERDFVLKPLLDIDPTWVHPVFNQTIQELWEAYQKEGGVNNIMRQWPQDAQAA